MSFADRLRAVVKAPVPPGPPAPPPAPGASPIAPGVTSRLDNLGAVLAGEWRAQGDSRCYVVERSVRSDTFYGTHPVGLFADQLQRAAAEAPLLARSTGGPGRPERPGDAVARPPFLFFDLETTGLNGGAGTCAFLVGCGWFDAAGAFVTKQYLLARPELEPALLAHVHDDITRAGALVSFNGKSFDAPVLEMRYLFHRLDWAGAALPHVDVLHPARRFWGGGECSLTALERGVLGVRRTGDVPGFEIPSRYFQFVRSGDARPLAAVLEHNRLDLLSLAALAARLLHLVSAGVRAAATAAEALALGRIYQLAGRDAAAREAYHGALDRAGLDRASGSTARTDEVHDNIRENVRVEALRSLALLERRGRRYDEAARHWRGVLDIAGCPPAVARQATEALAIHHEHRVRDLEAARRFALRSLDAGARPGWAAAVRHRVARIERKLEDATALESARARQAALALEAP